MTTKTKERSVHRSETIERILDAAESCFMERGVGGTSIDQMIKKAGISKGNFFYYFKGKEELTLRLTERYYQREIALLDKLTAAAESACEDPLDQVLHILESLRNLYRGSAAAKNPGCLYAVLVYEPELVNTEVHQVTQRSVESWRKRFGEKLQRAIEQHPPLIKVNPKSIADQMNATLGGALIVSRIENSPALIAEQLEHSIHYLRLLFDRPGAPRRH
jgi:TetR/AcrR family transcriptional repressor of nem operon